MVRSTMMIGQCDSSSSRALSLFHLCECMQIRDFTLGANALDREQRDEIKRDEQLDQLIKSMVSPAPFLQL